MPAGRPRTVSLPKEEMIKLGKEMVKWVKENDPLHLSEWYTIEKGYTYNEWKTMHVAPEFFPYYEQALKIVGRKYLDKNSNIRDGISHRWLRVYFKDFKEEEDAKLAYEASLKENQDKEKTTNNTYYVNYDPRDPLPLPSTNLSAADSEGSP